MGTNGFVFVSSSQILRITREGDRFETRLTESNHKLLSFYGPMFEGQFIGRREPWYWGLSNIERLMPDQVNWERWREMDFALRHDPSFRPLSSPFLPNMMYFKSKNGLFLYDGETVSMVSGVDDVLAAKRFTTHDSAIAERLLLLSPGQIDVITPDGSALPFAENLPDGKMEIYSFEEDDYLDAVTFRIEGQLHALWPNGHVEPLTERIVTHLDSSALPPDLSKPPWPGVEVITRENSLWLRVAESRDRAPSCP